jgi:hypothetical protein
MWHLYGHLAGLRLQGWVVKHWGGALTLSRYCCGQSEQLRDNLLGHQKKVEGKCSALDQGTEEQVEMKNILSVACPHCTGERKDVPSLEASY